MEERETIKISFVQPVKEGYVVLKDEIKTGLTIALKTLARQLL